ncbi:hypothetical protein CRG98_038329 [Punica granatum]|uniref:Uncharacterized protein n=1 Tax=Punica granatum TaxID=22663 RepID=A0A2I0IBB3_PUNGR|nr:hypothetical protein CRG98_038329 [Punica granatum]
MNRGKCEVSCWILRYNNNPSTGFKVVKRSMEVAVDGVQEVVCTVEWLSGRDLRVTGRVRIVRDPSRKNRTTRHSRRGRRTQGNPKIYKARFHSALERVARDSKWLNGCHQWIQKVENRWGMYFFEVWVRSKSREKITQRWSTRQCARGRWRTKRLEPLEPMEVAHMSVVMVLLNVLAVHPKKPMEGDGPMVHPNTPVVHPKGLMVVVHISTEEVENMPEPMG